MGLAKKVRFEGTRPQSLIVVRKVIALMQFCVKRLCGEPSLRSEEAGHQLTVEKVLPGSKQVRFFSKPIMIMRL
jgi:hypothetical protein